MKSSTVLVVVGLFLGLTLVPVSFAHRSGCHSWYSCPSDTGSYVCGSKGYCSNCPDNDYCLGGEPKSEVSTYKIIKKNLDCKGTFEDSLKRVVDGDTIELTTCKKTVRFALSDAFELYTKKGKEAKNFLETSCPKGSILKIDEDDGQKKGSYGRMVALVNCNGKNLNEDILVNSFGTIDKRYCKVSEFSSNNWATTYGC